MKRRFGLALLALIGLTAFAPAPFPRTGRRGQAGEISLRTVQGFWRATSMQVSRAEGQLMPDPEERQYTHVRIIQDRWTFTTGDREGSTLFISINPTNEAVLLNFYKRANKDAVYGVALLSRLGAQVRIAYRWGDETNRPHSFERLPEGLWVVTLERS